MKNHPRRHSQLRALDGRTTSTPAGSLGALGATAFLGLGAAAWGVVEAHAYTLRRRSILVSSTGTLNAVESAATSANQSLRILHLSDIHMVARQHRKAEWIRSLEATEPDVIVLTGDLLADTAALPELLHALEPFERTPGAFVFGSNDYYSPHFKNPFSYLARQWLGKKGDDKYRDRQRDLPWREMTAAFEARDWFNLNNARATCTIGAWNVSFVGVDDPHIGLDRFPEPEAAHTTGAQTTGAQTTGRPVHIGLTHAPYQRILNRMAEDACSLVFSGHTHGGQVCLPGYGTIVTNCDIDRELAYGLFRWPPAQISARKGLHTHVVKGDGAVAFRDAPAGELPGSAAGQAPADAPLHPMWVNVTTGLGTSPYSPVRVACRPEAVQVDIIAL